MQAIPLPRRARTATDRATAALDAVRRPEYTGENRCLPCTAVNVGIAGAAALGVGVVSPVAGTAVLAGSLAAIYLRGYLVPGTPELTKRYLPDRVLRYFEKDARAAWRSGDVAPMAVLVDAGVVVDDERAADVRLDPAFEVAWHDRMAAVSDRGREADDLARLLGLAADSVDVTWHDAAAVARVDGHLVGQWESRAAFVADVAAADLLAADYDGWTDLPLAARSEVLGALRACLDRCPACDGPVEFGREVVESCCRAVDVVAATCGACDARLFEVEYDAAAMADPEPGAAADGDAA